MRFCLLLALALLGQSGISQRANSGSTDQKYSVSGQIIDQETGNPLEYATVAFINSEGSIVEGGITDLDGKYSIDVQRGVYTIRYEYISYNTIEKTEQRIFENTQLPTISMSLDSESLDEVVVRAETTEVQIRLDKKIYNIGKDLTTSGATVGDALSNVPSVTVDVEGAIALRGNENVQILINGKPSAIAGFGSTDALTQLPADAIEKVEVITSASARYDAEGTAGILNIVLKKEKTLGVNGSAILNLGYPYSAQLTTNFNVRTEKFNFFNTTGLQYREAPGNGRFENIFFSKNVDNPLVIEDRDIERIRRGFNTNLGVEYYIDDNSSVTATGFYRKSKDDDETVNLTEEFDPSGQLDKSRERVEYETEDDYTFQFSANYTNRLDDNGQLLTADFQWENGKETSPAIIQEAQLFPTPEPLPTEDITEITEETEYLAQADYVLPIGENAQFEAGYRGRFQNEVTDYLLLQQLVAGGPFVRNDSLSNIFDFTQNIHALYTQYGNKFGKFSFLLGLRMETTKLKGEVTGVDVTSENENALLNLGFDKDFIGLFPTVNLVYEITEDENVTFGYNRRINRPRGFFINPFPSRSSEANIFQGNPDLNPAYASAFDLGYLKRWSKMTLTSSVYYQYETDAFERIQEDTGFETPNGIPIIRTIPINLSTNQRMGFEAGMIYNPSRKIQLNGSFNIFRFIKDGEFNGVVYDADDTSWFARLSTKIMLPAAIQWQTNGFYRGPTRNAQTENEGILSINTALSKDILNDNATIVFNVRDLFNSRIRRSFTETPTFTSDSEFQWRVRSFNLSFTYRFNQKKRQSRGRGNDNFDDGEEFGGGGRANP
ncbi:TonB-dependent receptor domain-containing protein [Aureitalea marina]|uniref:TonB-dependent receptor n=1 Tax=Aureitalea marina TaxID=930804 RepID=A0A2S7KPF8_9FLAO|nr:outer membrane beta-barrel family protein [Aureitalea marina]PQB04516.1 TonB-dependent receptor [Aureitalea marina]